MYRKQNMTEIPVGVTSEIFDKLEHIGLHPVHRAFSSMLEDDNALMKTLQLRHRLKLTEWLIMTPIISISFAGQMQCHMPTLSSRWAAG